MPLGRRGIEIGIMEKVKEKAVEFLLGIISKKDFEVILYDKVMSEDLIQNKLLFELIDINYRKEYFKEKVFEIYTSKIDEKVFIIYKVVMYCSKIINSETDSEVIKWFEKTLNVYSFEKDYGLMWDFVELSDRLGFVYLKYEKEENILRDVKQLSISVLEKFQNAITVEGKYKLLEDGIDFECKLNKKWYKFWK